jgi:PadR family transcriptional regulator PadR
MAVISSDIIRGYIDTMILYVLLEEPSYGYEISKQIKTLSNGQYTIKETTLYSAFTRMEKNGYIKSYPKVGDNGGKKRTYYQITDSGLAYYHSRCEEWELTKEVVEKFVSRQE